MQVYLNIMGSFYLQKVKTIILLVNLNHSKNIVKGNSMKKNVMSLSFLLSA